MPTDLQLTWASSLQHARTHTRTKTPTCVPNHLTFCNAQGATKTAVIWHG